MHRTCLGQVVVTCRWRDDMGLGTWGADKILIGRQLAPNNLPGLTCIAHPRTLTAVAVSAYPALTGLHHTGFPCDTHLL